MHYYILPLPSSCNLHQLCIVSRYGINLSAPSVHVLSAHGELEQVTLFVRSITTSAITTLISNSPNLMSLYIVTNELCDKNGVRLNWEDRNKYNDTVSKTFSYHKLLTTGDFILTEMYAYSWYTVRDKILAHCNTNFNSFWNL